MTQNDKQDRITEVLDDLTADELYSIHRRFIEVTGYYEGAIFRVGELEEVAERNGEPDALCYTNSRNYNPNFGYFRFDAYGNFESVCELWLHSYIDKNVIAWGCVEKNDALSCDKIQAILDGTNEDEDEEA